MEMETFDHIIVGAGISGLNTAKLLLEEKSNAKILILEANDRIGGRIYSPHGHDMGATWTWPSHDRRVTSLSKELGITDFEDDYNMNIVSIRNNERYNLPQQLRFIGGSDKLALGIAKIIEKQVKFILQHKVTHVSKTSKIDSIKVDAISLNDENSNVSFVGRTVILAVPPRLILRDMVFVPDLSVKKKDAMKNTPIWMEKASKAYISYKNKEWNDNDFPMFLKGLVVFDTTNDLVAAESSLKTFSLCVFNTGRPIHFTNEFIDNNVLMMLSKKIGRPSMLTNEHSILTHNWALEQFTSEESTFSKAQSSMDDAHMFGDPILRDPHAGNMFFSSTETEDEYGHIEGALLSAERTVSQIRKYFTSSIIEA